MYGQPYGGAGNNSRYQQFFAQKTGPFQESTPFQRGLYFVKGQRRRMNAVAILIALLVPWVMFISVFGVISFSLHYKLPYITNILVALAAGVCIMSAFLAIKAMVNKNLDNQYQPSWYVFISVTCLTAFVVAFMAGENNYYTWMQPYYNYENLATYKDIDTNTYLGQQLMDAGRIDFKSGTKLDLGKSMGFKNKDVYCVAPIMTQGSSTTAQSVDFWAVGKNCCSGVQADFHCSGFSDPKATGVIRMMSDSERPFYRLAVQQAEATYKLTATHPLFFQWVHSADEAVNQYWHQGTFRYLVWICGYFVFQGFLTVATTLAFSKLVHA